MALVLGTAGHIDHGKTSLVRALTGIDCDRLEEEKRRGITIELGFAWADLPDGERLGIVDVPGHERFVKNMVAGAAGVDFVMLVIAADEGVMPQTREHLDICTLLGIDRGFVALTKCDMVDAQWLELVQEDIRSFLKGSFLENAPVFPVSSVTGEGLEALRAHIYRCAAEIPPRRPTDLFRLPIDRVFGMKGHGTVVTGTVISGGLESGEELVAMPEGIAVRARSLQRHGAPAEVVRAGQRCAVNVQGTETDSLRRGQVLARPGTLENLFLRGKVAYLFERYCEERELTSMLLCIGPSNQEVQDLPRAVYEWICSTHGEDPRSRAGRPTSLFFILSKMDMEFEKKAGTPSVEKRWDTRLQSSLLDFFGKQHDWPDKWDGEHPFNNIYLLRNPNFRCDAIFNFDADGREIAVRPEQADYVEEVRQAFLNSELVRRHVARPDAVWNAAMTLNDGGVALLRESLRPLCNPELKRQQIEVIAGEKREQVRTRLEP